MKRATALLLLIGIHSHPTPAHAQGETRILICRGKPGIDLKVTMNPSPHNDKDVRMTLHYGITPPPVGSQDEHLQPGTCTWNEQGYSTIPREPGYVIFELHALAQPWFATNTRQMDTTDNAAIFLLDTISVRKYLSNPNHYWRFFVDDATNYSNSHNPTKTSVRDPTYVTVTGAYPFTSRPAASSSESTTESTSPEAASAMRDSAPQKTAPAAPVKLTFRRLVRKRDGFAALFSARPNAAVRVSYSTGRPVKTPQGWYFEGAAVQGSGAVSRGGFDAEIAKSTSSSASALYSGSSRLPLERGANYNFIITVEGNGPLEQFVGSFKALQQDVSVVISTLTVTKSSVKQNVAGGTQIFSNKAGSYVFCDAGECKNAPDVLGLLIYAQPVFGNEAPPPTSWTAMPGKNSGVAKFVMDTRMISMDRPMRTFNVTSLPGDIQFEAIAQVHVTWH